MKNRFALCCILVFAATVFCSFGTKSEVATSSKNPTAFITDPSKVQMLQSLKDLDGTGRILEMNYTADYKLQDALNSQTSGLMSVLGFMSKYLYDKPMTSNPLGYGSGCSAFAASDFHSGDFLMGRNYDFGHRNPVTHQIDSITAIVVKTAPKGGKKSICMVDSYWLGLRKGFYTDGKTDVSILMAAPYAMMDGMNEDGLAIGVLQLNGNPTLQKDAGKPSVFLTVAMRLVLDRCSDVPSAVDTLKHYNMHMNMGMRCSYHFFLADAKGHYSIVEYIFEPGADVNKVNPTVMKVRPETDENRYVTNFYMDESLAKNDSLGAAIKNNSRPRYNILRDKLQMNEYKLSHEEAFQLLGCVGKGNTQWSSLYNLSKRTLDLAILRNYRNRFTFEVK